MPTISQLPAANSAAATNYLATDQAGGVTRRITIQQALDVDTSTVYMRYVGGAFTGAVTFNKTTKVGTGTNNILTITPGATTADATTFVSSGSAGVAFTGTAPLGSNVTNFGRGNTYTVSGGTIDVTKFGLYTNNNIKGTSTAPEIPVMGYVVGNTAVAGNGTNLQSGLMVIMTTTTGATSGGYQALSVSMNDGATKTSDKASGTSGVFQGLQIARRASLNQGGTGLTPATAFGSNWGMDIVNVAKSGATFLQLQHGLEINQAAETGSSVLRRFGLQISAPATHQVRGAMWDSAVEIGNALGAATLRNGIIFGDQIAGSVFGTDSNIIAYKVMQDTPIPPAPAGIGIDFNDADFTTASLRMPLWAVGPLGEMNVAATYFTPTSVGLEIDPKGSIGTGVPTVNAGGSGFLDLGAAPVPVLDDAYGGVYYGKAISGGAVTSVGVIRQPIYPDTSPPATLALTARAPSPGTGAILDGSWDSTRTLLSLNPSGGAIAVGAASTKIGFYGTAPVSKPTGVAVDAAGIHAALVTLGLIAA